jgi:hypothetical protein
MEEIRKLPEPETLSYFCHYRRNPTPEQKQIKRK